MRVLAMTLTLFAAALFGACGDKADDTKTGDNDTHEHEDGDGDHEHEDGDHDGDAPASMALAGASWDGGEGFDPTAKSDKVRIVAFFKPT